MPTNQFPHNDPARGARSLHIAYCAFMLISISLTASGQEQSQPPQIPSPQTTPQLVGFPIFQVRLSSADPDVIGFRVGVTFADLNVTVNGLPASFTVWGSVGKSPSSFVPQPAPPAPYYRYTFLLTSTNITGIQVQELKATSSQAF